jgi:hypothetical protein
MWTKYNPMSTYMFNFHFNTLHDFGFIVFHHLFANVVFFAFWQTPNTISAVTVLPIALHAIFWINNADNDFLLGIYNHALLFAGVLTVQFYLKNYRKHVSNELTYILSYTMSLPQETTHRTAPSSQSQLYPSPQSTTTSTANSLTAASVCL